MHQPTKYYVCSDSIFARLHQETQALFERYPEDDGIMIFKPDERIRRQAQRIAELEAELQNRKATNIEIVPDPKQLPKNWPPLPGTLFARASQGAAVYLCVRPSPDIIGCDLEPAREGKLVLGVSLETGMLYPITQPDPTREACKNAEPFVEYELVDPPLKVRRKN